MSRPDNTERETDGPQPPLAWVITPCASWVGGSETWYMAGQTACPTPPVVLLFPEQKKTQSCYYPNGDLSTTDGPCTSDPGAACCPLNWQCLSNGLCYLEAEKFYGRYTCTDKNWQSEQCPGFCTNNNKDAGDQAVQQCSDGSWCCDHNRDPANYCCDRSNNGDFFPLLKGSAYASINQLATGGSAATAELASPTVRVGVARPEPSSSSTSTTTPQRPSRPPARNPETPLIESKTVHDPASPGKTSVVFITSIVAPTLSTGTGTGTGTGEITFSPDSETQDKGSNPNVAAIAGGIGGGVAVVAGAALGVLFCINRRKKRRRDEGEQVPQTEYLADRKSIEYMYKGNEEGGTPFEEGGSPEIDGREVDSTSGAYRGVQPTNRGLGVYAAERLGEGEPSPLTTPSLGHQSHKMGMETQTNREISELP
ncbi:MAG: hypothetical protein Q9167_004722 [Letrouitia subvulpina]